MSLYDYMQSQQIVHRGYSWHALIMAAMTRADTDNLAALSAAFPETATELRERYNAPGGVLASDRQASPCQTQG